MNIEELKNLVAKGESDTLEFKKSTGLLKAVFQTTTAFLNNKGGTVLIGVSDDGKIIGQEVSESTQQKIAKELPKVEPPAKVDIQYINVDGGNQVIAVSVDANSHSPYTYDGRPYHRDLDDTNRMPQHLYEQKLVQRGQLNHSWESYPSEYRIDDLDHDEIYATVTDGIRERRVPASAVKDSIEEILERFKLIQNGKVTNAALVLFAKPHVYLPQCQLKMARFIGKDKLGDYIDNQQMSGNVFQLLNATDDFLRRHLPISSTFKTGQFKRIDKSALPVMAVREALINAFCHRDYSDRLTDFALAIYDNRLELWNSGTLLHNLTPESLKHSHASILRNKLIAGVFFARGLIEKWGTGTNKIVDLCRADKLPEPAFREETGGLMVTFEFKDSISSYVDDDLDATIMSIDDRRQALLHVIEQLGSAKIKNIIQKMANPPSLRTVQTDLRFLKDAGMVDSEEAGKNTVWVATKSK